MKDLKSGLPDATPHIHPNSEDWWQRNNSKLLTIFLPAFKINLQAIKNYINIFHRFNTRNNVCRLKDRRKILFKKYFHCNHLPCASRGGVKGF